MESHSSFYWDTWVQPHPPTLFFDDTLYYYYYFYARYYNYIPETKQVSRQSLLLFQLNLHNVLHTHIYHQLPSTCFIVCYTNFRETIVFLAQIYMLFTVLLHRLCYKMLNIPCFLNYNTVTVFKTICISSFCILKMLVKILFCSTLISLSNTVVPMKMA
jgi:hypothetical protein